MNENGVLIEEEETSEEKAAEAAPAVNANDPSMPLFDAKKPDFSNLVIEPLFEDLVEEQHLAALLDKFPREVGDAVALKVEVVHVYVQTLSVARVDLLLGVF